MDGDAGNDSVRNYQGHRAKIEVGAESGSVTNAISANVTIADGDDSIKNYNNSYSEMQGVDGNAHLTKYTTMIGGLGNDSVTNWHGNNSTIDGGGEDVYICESGNETMNVYPISARRQGFL